METKMNAEYQNAVHVTCRRIKGTQENLSLDTVIDNTKLIGTSIHNTQPQSKSNKDEGSSKVVKVKSTQHHQFYFVAMDSMQAANKLTELHRSITGWSENRLRKTKQDDCFRWN